MEDARCGINEGDGRTLGLWADCSTQPGPNDALAGLIDACLVMLTRLMNRGRRRKMSMLGKAG